MKPGCLLFIAGFAYITHSFTSLCLPHYGHLVSQFAMVLELGEWPIVLWLLIWGAKNRWIEGQLPAPALAL
ncbi:MAG: hypothetical protein QOE34_2956 [Verrucomicrobiota bacterium]|jgi:hypothetical protein